MDNTELEKRLDSVVLQMNMYINDFSTSQLDKLSHLIAFELMDREADKEDVEESDDC